MAHAISSAFPFAMDAMRSIAEGVERWRRTRALNRTIAELEALDDRSLEDIGLTRETISSVARGAAGFPR